MTQSSALTLPAQPMPTLSRAFSRLNMAALIWQQRRRTRHHLGDLTDHLLRDIGLDPVAALTEAAKPFWRA